MKSEARNQNIRSLALSFSLSLKKKKHGEYLGISRNRSNPSSFEADCQIQTASAAQQRGSVESLISMEEDKRESLLSLFAMTRTCSPISIDE